MDKNSNPDSDLTKGMEPVAPDMTPDPINRDQTKADTEVASIDNSEDISGMDAIINEFIVESYENLDQLDQDLVGLEQNPGEVNILSSIFRTIHTIKGTCGFIGFSKLESVAHVGENLLSKLRDGELVLDPPITSALLAMVDAIRQMLSCIEESQNEGDVDYSELIETLTTLQKGESAETAPVSPAPAESSPAETHEEVVPVAQDEPPAQVLVPESKTENEDSPAKPAEPGSGVERRQEGRGTELAARADGSAAERPLRRLRPDTPLPMPGGAQSRATARLPPPAASARPGRRAATRPGSRPTRSAVA